MVLHTFIFISHFFTYWIVSGIFFVADLYTKRFDTQENYARAAIGVLENQLFLSLPLVIFMDYYFPMQKELGIVHAVWQIPCLLFTHDILFYHLHRLMHTKYLYKYHKTHHRLKNLAGVGALWAGKIEHLFVNMLPAYLPPLYLYMNYVLIVGWVIIATTNVVVVHSGYDLFDKKHESHHKYLNVNYGLGVYLCDRLYGTYKS